VQNDGGSLAGGSSRQDRLGNSFLSELPQLGSKGGGTSVPFKGQMEQAFGQDFSGVQAILGDGQLGGLGMGAAAEGEQLRFADSRPSPDVVGHELAHVVQQRQSGPGAASTSQPGDSAERDADLAGQAAARGQNAQVRAGATGRVQANWLTDIGSAIGNAVGDALDIRENEAELDAWEDYQDALEDKRDFLAEPHKAEDFQSTTKIGMFDAAYTAGALTITVRCAFTFEDGKVADYAGATAADVTWDQASQDAWKQKWLAQCTSTWSGNHTFHCQEDWWEDLSAAVTVNFVESNNSPHYNMTILKIPTGEFNRSSVSSGDPGGIFGIGRSPGHGNFDSEDLTPTPKPGGTQVGAVHEAGHMLGLDDEYGAGTPSHSGMVDQDLGNTVSRGSDDRIMSGGMTVQPEHGVTFLAALREATDKKWEFGAKTPREIPPDPSLHNVGDFPTPDPNGPQYA